MLSLLRAERRKVEICAGSNRLMTAPVFLQLLSTDGFSHVMLISVPLSGSLEMSIRASWKIAPCFTMESPSPVPPTSFEWLLLTL